MQIITAPSKTQAFSNRICTAATQPQHLETSIRIMTRLKQLTRAELSALMKTSDKLTETTYHRIQSFSPPFTMENAHQAIFTFTGDAYDAIDADNYSDGELHHAQKHLTILSGLYGMLRPLDLMQPYRLEMAAKLELGSCKTLYELWKDKVTAALNNIISGQRDKTLINLASNEYARVVDKRRLGGEMIGIVFQQPHKTHKTGFATIPIHSKRARGLMIHYMIKKKIVLAEELQGFNLGGYSFVAEQSTPSTWLFRQGPKATEPA